MARLQNFFRSKISSTSLMLLGILLAGAYFRFYALSHGVTFHPDERHIVDVTQKLKLADMNPHSFAYGSFPFYFSWFVAQALGVFWPALTRYDGLFLVGRSIAALFGITIIYLTYILARRAYGSKSTSLLAAAFVALNVLCIQLSRFFAVDIFLTLWCIAALIAFIKLSQLGRARDYIISGICLGFAVATKISALTLLAPLGVAMLLAGVQFRDLFSPRRLSYAVVTLMIAGLVFLAVEPYAFLDYQTFYRQTKEQTDMVQGLWRPPYTIQYEGTTPFLYVLSQMTHYTMGIPLALAVFAGFIFACLKQFKKLDSAEIIMLAWVIPLFLAFGGLMVKFPRYFLPIYPVLFVLAAGGLGAASRALAASRLRALRAVPATIVLAWCTIYSTAFTSIYSVDHGYELASRWIFQNVPTGSKILGVDWDDKLPLFLPGLDPRRYKAEGRAWELPLYGNETPEKLAEISDKLARGDYIVFPTNRTYGSIPRVPHEYVFTTNCLRLLFAGKLGYELAQTIKVRPQFGPIIFDDDLADESLSVYDHPKISIFKKTEQLTPLDVRERILNAYQYRPLPTLDDMLRKNAGSAELPASTVQASMASIIVWLALLELLGLVALPILLKLLPNIPDRGYGIAKTFGLLLLGLLVWFAGSMHWVPTSSKTAWLVLVVLAGISALIFVYQRPTLRQIFSTNRAHFIAAEAMFLFGFFGFIVLRAFQPEIFWGEKPMDFTFLNYFIRLESLPPQDPWASGQVMRYYYLGTFLMALLHKLSGVDSGIGYNLCIATIAGLSLSAAYTFISIFCRRIWPAVLGASAVILLSNLEVVRLIFFGDKKSFDLFWASTRLYKEPGITEYPLWALLFADLHAHLIAYPIALGFLVLTARFMHHEREALTAQLVTHRIACGIFLGSLVAINSWDAISYGFVFGMLLVYRALLLTIGRKGRLRRAGLALLDLLRDIPLVTLGILPVLVPFMLSSGSQVSPGFGFNQSMEFNSIDQVLRHLGHWLLPLACGFIFLSFKGIRRTPRWELGGRVILALIIGALPVSICLLTRVLSFRWPAPPLEQLPWAIPGTCSALAFFAVFVGLAKRLPNSVRVASLLTYGALLIIAGAEICFLMDHMNTIFKFYNSVWLLLGVSVACLMPTTLRALWCMRPRTAAYVAGRPLCFILTGVFAIAFAGSVFNMHAMTTFQRVGGPRPTLDGMAYQFWANAQEAQVIRWIRQNIRGTPTILEAHGNSYGPFTRISMNTGLPTVLGWEHHVQQRGTPRASVIERQAAIDRIYSAPDPESALAELKLLGVDLVYVGQLERELYERGTYNRAGLAKWDHHPDVFEPLFRSGTSVVYKTAGARLP